MLLGCFIFYYFSITDLNIPETYINAADLLKPVFAARFKKELFWVNTPMIIFSIHLTIDILF